jgi:ABC-2 type transport system ATP-binding protein
METAFFPSREAAQASGAASNKGFTLRRVNLEDAFLSMTGKKVDTSADETKTIHGGQAHGHHGHGHGSHGGHGGHAKKAHAGHGAH